MASSKWGTDCSLDESLFASGHEFDFFQAVRLLTQLHEERHPGMPGLSADVVRFCAHNSLAFPASSIHGIDRGNGGPPRMAVTFMGMTGPEGALPAAYTEIAVEREYFGDRSLADFLDLFNHRLIHLFFEAWKKHHFVIGYEQSRRRRKLGEDEFSSYLFDLIGMGTLGLKDRLPVADTGLLCYAGLFAQRPHSAETLRAFLHDYFEVPVRIEQFIGKWHTLESDELCSLGSGEISSQLGGGAVAGNEVWSQQGLMSVVLGPLSAAQFLEFLPDGKSFARMAALVRWFLGSTLEFEIQPILGRDEVPYCRLSDGDADNARLGWSAWLKTEPFWFNATNAVFSEYEQVSQES